MEKKTKSSVALFVLSIVGITGTLIYWLSLIHWSIGMFAVFIALFILSVYLGVND